MIPGLFNRRKSDEKHMANLQSAQGEGKPYRFVTRSKKTSNPKTGASIPRGSAVSTHTTESKPAGNTFQLKVSAQPGHVETTKKYVPGDYNKPGNPIIDRPTTKDLGKSLNEPPAKTEARMKAQTEGKTSYTAPSGKQEYAGRHTNSFRITAPTVTSSMTMTPSVPAAKKTSLTVIAPSANGPLRRGHADPVPWVSGMSKGAQKSMSRFGAKKSYSYRSRAKKNLNP